MIPWPLVFAVAGLGSPTLPAESAARVRAAVPAPVGSYVVALALSPDGHFTWAGETAEMGRGTHRPLKLRTARFAGTSADIEGLSALALSDEFGETVFGISVIPLAIDRCRTRLRGHPDDASAMVRLGCLLYRAGRIDDGERWLYRATEVAPREWETWHTLASHHLCRVGQLIYGANRPATGDLNASNFRADLANAPAEVQRAAERHLRRAADCYDWAVLFAPDDAEPYAARLQWNWSLPAYVLFERTERLNATSDGWECFRRLSADARKVAELSGHPLAYGLTLFAGCPDLAVGASGEPSREVRRYWERAVQHLEAMQSGSDPITVADATRVLILAKSLVFQDFEEGRRLLGKLPDSSWDRTVFPLATLVYAGLGDSHGLAALIDKRMKPDDPYAFFVLASAREHGGQTARANEAVLAGLRKYPADVRLNLMRTALLLKHGSAAELVEVHVRLLGVEAAIAVRWPTGPDRFPAGWTEKDSSLLQVARLHRAAYLGLLGRTAAADRMARSSLSWSEDGVPAATDLLLALDPLPVPDKPEFLSAPGSLLPAGGQTPKLPVLERPGHPTPPVVPYSR
jgi:tetratricopeptide (TPR) repeat protein